MVTVGVESFWPQTATGWVGLVASVLGLLTAGAVVVGWMRPTVRRRLRLVAKDDIRVRVLASIAHGPCVQVTVENHSSKDFPLRDIWLAGDADWFGDWPDVDATGRRNDGATIKPGDTYEFFVPGARAIGPNGRAAQFAVAVSKLEREYRSPGGTVSEACEFLRYLGARI